jgi:glycosyltransferase involved in cell wall biosynthesis
VASPYETAVVAVNARELIAMAGDDVTFLHGKHRIGFWNWELPVFPAAWAGAFGMVDEIWAPSRFTADSLASATTKPVKVVPIAVRSAQPDQAAARALLKLPPDAFVFLTTFDASSYVARKNPEAVVRAFVDAFPQADANGPLLVVKCHCPAGETDTLQPLLRLARRHNRIIVINRVFSSVEMTALSGAADVFVSLHRSEGFGLNIAEAMAAGRLAIATNFSGNTDFMTAENSVLVPYRMRAVEPSEYFYGTGQWWAEPDHDAAVEALRMAVNERAATARLVERARRDLAAKFSPEAVGRILQAALHQS